MKTKEEIRNKLLSCVKLESKDIAYRSGYADGVLDMYNEAKKNEAEAVSTK